MMHDFDHINLCQADAEMLDRLVEVGYKLDQLKGLTVEETQRANAVLELINMLHAYPVEDASDTLIDVTLARIDQYESQLEGRMQFGTSDVTATKGGFRIRMPDFISIAAVLLIAASVVTMVYQTSRARSMSSQCASNMAMVGFGLVNYASDHNGQMPTTAAASFVSFFEDGVPLRTDPNTLVDSGYCNHNHLLCPGCAGDSSGYSYQTQTAESWEAIRKQGHLLVVLSDKNPILDKYLAGNVFDPLTPSKSHGSLGQNQLKSDGSTTPPLMGPPVIGGDLIWILDGKKRNFDIFLTH